MDNSNKNSVPFILTKENVPVLLSKFTEVLKNKVEKAYIFGSVARGDFHQDSDFDIILIFNSPRPFVERGKDFFFLYDVYPGIDILVYTQEEFDRQLRERSDLGFWKDIARDMQQII